MARRIDWDDAIGRAVFWAVLPPLALVERFRTWAGPYEPRHQPIPGGIELRYCKDCKTETLCEDFYWAVERETTRECHECGGVWVVG